MSSQAVNASFLNHFHQKLRKLNLHEGDILFLESLLYRYTPSRSTSEALKQFYMLSNLSIHLISPVGGIKDSSMEEIKHLFLADDGSIHQVEIMEQVQIDVSRYPLASNEVGVQTKTSFTSKDWGVVILTWKKGSR
ncbi:hypothetical protein Tco_0326566 [Tanacetum coccineum]